MKTILRVAGTELRSLFYSPIAWFLLIVFIIQSGLAYLGMLENYAKTQDLGGMGLDYMSNLTLRIFLSPGGVFSTVMQNLYLYVPLLTMGLISRETSSGTIKLLYSSPIKVREIVLGKFVSMMAFNLLLVLAVGIFMVSGMFHIQSPETGMLLSGALGFYLLLCAYSSIGLFMSCLTTYQLVAAISTFIMVGILSYIGTLWQRIELVRELTYYLSIAGRTQRMLVGLITTKDVLYFVIITYIFLGLSVYKLRAGMESKSAMVRAGRYLAVIASALLIGYVSSIPGLIGYWDVTSNKSRTLTPKVQKIIQELGDEPLEVTAYANLLDNYWYLGSPEAYNENQTRWEPFLRFKPDIKLNTVRYYDTTYGAGYIWRGYPGKSLNEVAEKYAKSMEVDLSKLVKPEEIRKKIDLQPEMNRYVMQLKYKGKTTFLRVFDDQEVWPSETEVSAALKRLLQANMPKIAFVTGSLERDISKLGDKEYKALTNLSTFRNSLVNQGFDVQTIALEEEEIPANIASLVIADPKVEMSAAALSKLQAYIDAGGNLFIAGEPGRQAVLNPFLQQFGVQLLDGMIMQESKDNAPNLATPELTDLAASFSKTLFKRKKDSVNVSMPGAAALSYQPTNGYLIKPLLVTNEKTSWNKVKKVDLELFNTANASSSMVAMGGAIVMSASGAGGEAEEPKKKKRDLSGIVRFAAEEGDVRGPLATVVSLTRNVNNKEQRIVIAGDADFMSNIELQRFNMRTANFVFNTSLFSWLSNGEFPVDTSRPDPKDNRVNVTPEQVDYLRILYIWVLPGILLAFGAVLLMRRKRK